MMTTDVSERLRYIALDPADLERYRTTALDDFGNALEPEIVESGASAPCRACLRIAGPGETVLLLAYRPFATSGPYAETGPIFIHASPCAEPEPGFPADFLARTLTLRAYDAAGRIAHATVANGGAAEAWIAETLADPGISTVHVRNPSYGCYDFRVVRN